MANTIEVETIYDGLTDCAVMVNILGDGSGEETNLIVVNVSELSPVPTEVRIMRIQVSIGLTFLVQLLWAADLNVLAMNLMPTWQDWKFWQFGGLRNRATVGRTGDILMTTYGLGANEYGSFVIEMQKAFEDDV